MAESTSTVPVSDEQWHPVIGYEGWYSVSDLGRFRREKAIKGANVGRILKWMIDHHGYPFAVLTKENRGKRIYAHIAVAAAFIGPRPEGYDINHINGIKDDPRPENLEYCTHTENVRHAFRTGLKTTFCSLPGESNPGAKLTAAQVAEIRVLLSQGYSGRSLARRFGVSKTLVMYIKQGRVWKTAG